MPVALVVVLAAVAGCRGSRHSGHSTVALAVVSQRYQAAVGPANTAVAAMLQQALAYSTAPTNLSPTATSTVTVVKKASSQLNAIAAPEPPKKDIVAVASAMDGVVADLTTLATAKGGDIEPDIARFVADAGRLTAAETVVQEELALLSAPTTAPLDTTPIDTAPPDTQTTATSVPTATSTSVVSTSTTTVRPTTTTVPRTTTTRSTTTTTASTASTTTTSTMPRTTTTVKKKPPGGLQL
jgi:hypothetical protein